MEGVDLEFHQLDVKFEDNRAGAISFAWRSTTRRIRLEEGAPVAQSG